MRQALHSFSVLDHLLAVGGQGEIFFWDRRAPAVPVLKLPDTHMDEVTQVGGRGGEGRVCSAGRGRVWGGGIALGVGWGGGELHSESELGRCSKAKLCHPTC